jgi:hypothetical protein
MVVWLGKPLSSFYLTMIHIYPAGMSYVVLTLVFFLTQYSTNIGDGGGPGVVIRGLFYFSWRG